MAQQYRRYAEVLQREITDLGPTTRQVHGMERIPIFPPRRLTGGLRLPTVGFGKATHFKEVFNEAFYDIFPWARGVDPFDESRTDWEPADWYVENQIQLGNGLEPDQSAEVPPAIAFINGLISLELDDLEKGDRSCAICLQPYREGDFPEIPLQLPCGHTFGKDCLLSWLSDIGDDGAHIACCPLCRKECISEKRKHIGTYEGLKQLLRDTNYVLTGMKGLSLTQEGREEWEDVMAYVNEYLAEIEEAKRQRLQRFMTKLRQGLKDFPLTVAPASVNAIGRDVVALRTTMSQLLDELEQRGIIATYLDGADEDSDEDETAERFAQLADIIPSALLNYMDEVYAERYNLEPDDQDFPADDIEGDGTLENEGVVDIAEDNGIYTADNAESEDADEVEMTNAELDQESELPETACDDSTVTREICLDQINEGASRARRYSWIRLNETQHWAWQGSDDLDMEDVQINFGDEELPADSDAERAMRLLGRRVQDTYDAVMYNRP